MPLVYQNTDCPVNTTLKFDRRRRGEINEKSFNNPHHHWSLIDKSQMQNNIASAQQSLLQIQGSHRKVAHLVSPVTQSWVLPLEALLDLFSAASLP